jgi:hypothetical protein
MNLDERPEAKTDQTRNRYELLDKIIN